MHPVSTAERKLIFFISKLFYFKKKFSSVFWHQITKLNRFIVHIWLLDLDLGIKSSMSSVIMCASFHI